MEPQSVRILGPDDEGRRLDKIARKAFPHLSLSFLHKALRTGGLKIDGRLRRPDYLCRAGERLETFFSETMPSSHGKNIGDTPLKMQVLPTDLILFESKSLLFVNKPFGTLVHDGSASLSSMVCAYILGKTDSHSVSFMPGPLHRLDRNTSGIVTFSKTLFGATTFSKALSEISKTYLALLEGRILHPATWEDRLLRNEESRKSTVSPIGSEAITHMHPVAFVGGSTLVELKLETGRTHQIRAQSAAHGHPLLGDVKYGGKRSSLPYYLHALSLESIDTFFPDIPSKITAPLPEYFLNYLKNAGVKAENALYSYLNNQDQ